MPDSIFPVARVYKLHSNYTNYIYIGSTTLPLSLRFQLHNSRFNKYIKNIDNRYLTSFDILCFLDCEIEELETLYNVTKKELIKKEAEYIRFFKQLGICINKNIPYREEGEYYKENREQIICKSKDYYIQNKDRIMENKKRCIICDKCQSITNQNHKSRHEKTNKCLEINNNNKIYELVSFLKTL